MAVFLLVAAAFVLLLCLSGSGTRKVTLGVIAALLYFPFGVILSLSKKFK